MGFVARPASEQIPMAGRRNTDEAVEQIPTAGRRTTNEGQIPMGPATNLHFSVHTTLWDLGQLQSKLPSEFDLHI